MSSNSSRTLHPIYTVLIPIKTQGNQLHPTSCHMLTILHIEVTLHTNRLLAVLKRTVLCTPSGCTMFTCKLEWNMRLLYAPALELGTRSLTVHK